MGPLAGVKVVEIAGLGPGPFCAMLLADMGADVLRVERAGGGFAIAEPKRDLMNRNRRSVAVDLKHPRGAEVVLRLCARADALIEGFRPGVMERLGLGPDDCLARNPRLVYGRMTGFGQTGPLAKAAGHDLNYIALSGALHAIGRAGEKPVVPLNLVGDFGGGGMLLAFGVACALFEARGSGRGQVVDAAMVDGSSLLMTLFHGLGAMGLWSDARGTNLLDGGAHFYDTYETKDGRHVSVAALEPKFYAELVRLTGADPARFASQLDPSTWPALRDELAALFRTKTQGEWCALLEGSDACFAPVLSMAEAAAHPHARARSAFVEQDGVTQPAPAPRFSRTPPELRRGPPSPGEHTDTALADWGFDAAELAALRDAGAIG